MKEDIRVPFDKALLSFRSFLKSQDIPTKLLWLSKDRTSQHGRVWWVFRPEELENSDSSRLFYESVRLSSSSIRLDGYRFTPELTLAWVEDYGGPSKLLNFGLLTSSYEIRVVRNRLMWRCIRSWNWLKDIRNRSFSRNITPRTEHAASPNR